MTSSELIPAAVLLTRYYCRPPALLEHAHHLRQSKSVAICRTLIWINANFYVLQKQVLKRFVSRIVAIGCHSA